MNEDGFPHEQFTCLILLGCNWILGQLVLILMGSILPLTFPLILSTALALLVIVWSLTELKGYRHD